ncbi:3-methyl-2-oxobutanoate hydroxymethyltransferase [Commensalibacter sp. Nvir]|uniref:3-methyl-2-oxobutanoate hydroxymethyltransferase n=1 Tax=Commensalibacter sp. Nvir TaxID=3069817 RepID=UPI002D2D7C84|nr:3-methyl-2-oxobutanoate hydroxymethyltransferase [Commensalibacter sp. Nvir]
MNITTYKRLTAPDIQSQKGKEPIVCLTAYTASQATIMDPYVDFILVGDSLGMVVYGLPSTLSVTVDMMVAHGAAVVRGSKRACIVIDLPFGSYQETPQQAFQTASRLLRETGANAVKLEGGEEMAATIEFLTHRGIPVCGHIGLMPQTIQTMGGYKISGKNDLQINKIINDGKAVANAGAFAVVLEGVVEPVAQRITETLEIPTIGIGASLQCDGQILVCDDIFGIFQNFKPKFVKKYAELGSEMDKAISTYAKEVKSRQFPQKEHCFYPAQKK